MLPSGALLQAISRALDVARRADPDTVFRLLAAASMAVASADVLQLCAGAASTPLGISVGAIAAAACWHWTGRYARADERSAARSQEPPPEPAGACRTVHVLRNALAVVGMASAELRSLPVAEAPEVSEELRLIELAIERARTVEHACDGARGGR